MFFFLLHLLTTIGMAKPGWEQFSLQSAGTERRVRVYTPKAPAKPAPVVVLLHGGTQGMTAIFRPNAGGTRAWPELAEREGFLLLVPNGTNARTGDPTGKNQNWNDLRPPNSTYQPKADDVRFIGDLLDWAARTYTVDTTRIYVTGASNGGMMTYRLLVEIPEKFAAGVAFIASLPVDDSRLKQPSRPTPLMIVNGTKDPLVRWTGG